jgi:acyl-CoA thioesterase-1
MLFTLRSGLARSAYRASLRLVLSAACAILSILGSGTPGRAEALPATARRAVTLYGAGSALALPGLAARLRQRHHLSIIAFGSSSTEGVGASSPAHAYPALLQKYLQQGLVPGDTVTVTNRGIGGQDADDMLARLATDVIAQKPDLVIWQTGTNDLLRNVPLSRFDAETREGIRRMRAAAIDVVLMEPQDCRMMRGTPGARAYREAVRAIGLEMGVPVIKRYDLIKAWLADGTVTEARLMAPDGLHMSDEGYARLAIEVAREVMTDAGIKSKLVTTITAR